MISSFCVVWALISPLMRGILQCNLVKDTVIESDQTRARTDGLKFLPPKKEENKKKNYRRVDPDYLPRKSFVFAVWRKSNLGHSKRPPTLNDHRNEQRPCAWHTAFDRGRMIRITCAKWLENACASVRKSLEG